MATKDDMPGMPDQSGRVLLVQADLVVTDAMKRALQVHSLGVIESSSFKQAMRMLENDFRIDLVIASTAVQGSTGLDFLQAVKENPRFQYLPVMLVAEHCSSELVVNALRNGAIDVVSMPTSDEQLLSRVDTAIAKGKRRVLVVDDEQVISEYLADVLQVERFTPITASSGEEALQILQKTTVHAVISDVMMPGMNGMDLLVRIKEMNTHLPVILITAYGGRFTPQTALAAGADGYLLKPFKNTELVRTLRTLLMRNEHKAKV